MRATLVLLATLVAVIGAAAPAVAASQKRVLVVSEFRPDTPGTTAIESAVRASLTFTLGNDLDYYTEHIDASRFAQRGDLVTMHEFLHRRYGELRIDLVIAIGRIALELIADDESPLFRGTPVVAIVSSDNGADLLRALATRAPVTGIVETLDVRGTVDFILTVQPDVREVVLIGGRSESDALFEARARRQLQRYDRPVTLRYSSEKPLDDILSEVSVLGPRTAVLFLSMQEDGAGRRLDSGEVLLGILGASKAPVYALRAAHIESDVVGGWVADGGVEGEEIAATAVRILRGEAPRDIAVRDSLGIRPVASSRALRRWGLSEARLPAGTVLVHEDPTLWDRYAPYFVGTAFLIALQAGLIFTLIAQHARRRETEARNHAILRAVPDLMFLQDDKGRYLDCHAPEPTRLLMPPERFLGRTMRDVLPDSILASIEEAFTRVLETQAPATVEYGLHIGDEERRFEARLVPHEHRRVLSIVRDVTARHRAEMALRDAHADLVRISKLAALGEFAASIAHEVSQPLTAIVTNARTCLRWLKETAPDVTELRLALLDIVSSGNRAQAIVTHNRELFRNRSVRKGAVDINQMILETEEFARARIQAAGASLRCDLDGDLPMVLGDRLELQQVLLNLIVNGIEAMEDVEKPSRRLLVTSAKLDQPGDGVQVTVSDGGTGLDGLDLERIFAPGYTTKASGTGFGLSVSRTVIEAHGGRLWAAPNGDSGATFGFTVPLDANGMPPETIGRRASAPRSEAAAAARSGVGE